MPRTIQSLRLSQLLESLESGGRPKGGVGSIRSGIPSVGGEHITRSGGFDFSEIRFIPEVYYDSMRRGRIRPHDILLVKDGATTGKVAYVDEVFPHDRAAVNEHVFIIRPSKDKVVPRYLFFFLYSPSGQSQILSSFHGAAQGGINSSFADDVVVPVPPRSVQEKMVTVLEKTYRLRILREQANQLTGKIIQSVFLKMFGDPAQLSSKYEASKLGDLAVRRRYAVSSGPFGSNLGTKDYVQSGVLVVRGTNVKANEFDTSECKFVTEKKAAELERSQANPRDLVVVAVGASGRACIIPDSIQRSILSQNCNKITLDQSLAMPDYVCYLLNTGYFQSELSRVTTDTVRKFLSLTNLARFLIPLPPIEQQRKFVDVLGKMNRLRERQAQSAQEINELFDSLMHKAFAGEIKTAATISEA